MILIIALSVDNEVDNSVSGRRHADMLRLLCFGTLICFAPVPVSQAQYTVSTVNLTSVAPDTRIIGGTATTIQRFPYTVQIQQNNRLICGGSLITRRHVLSAAHCFINFETGNVVSPRQYSIRAGTSNLESGGQTRQVSAIIVHERYNRVTHDADVAVLLLGADVTLGSSVGLAAVPVQGAAMADNTALIHVGWGHTSINGNLASVLQEVQVLKVNNTECARRYRLLGALLNIPYDVTTNMICAGLLGVGGADACQGDSGGPLALQVNRTVVVGITSWGHNCGEAEFPGVSARISNFTNWIHATVQRYNSAPSLSVSSAALLLASLLASLTVVKDV